jgi:hypothetical protein
METVENALSCIVFSCTICGNFKTTIPIFPNVAKNMLASYLFCKTKESAPLIITTEGNIDEAKEVYHEHTVVTIKYVKEWYPRTDEEKIDKILYGLSKHSKYDDGLITLDTEELYSAFLVERYSSVETARLPDDKLQVQVEWVYDRLRERDFIANNTSNFADGRKRNQHTISLKWEGQKRVNSLR